MKKILWWFFSSPNSASFGISLRSIVLWLKVLTHILKIRQNFDLNTCKNITTDCTAYKWWSTESTRSKHYFAINNLSALSIVSFLFTWNHFTDGNFLHLASFSIKLQGDTYFQDMNLIYFSRYLYIPPESHIKCQIKSKIIVPPYFRWLWCQEKKVWDSQTLRGPFIYNTIW